MNELARIVITVTIFLPLIFGGSGMARYTRPVPGRSDTYPNAGPYTGDQWAELLNITHVGDEADTRGPYASYLNRLEVTNPAAADFQIDTGAGLVNGHLLINSVAVTITADTPAANPRIDRVVMVYNNTNAAIAATTVGGFTFNVAGGGTDIPAYTAELAIMKGAENAAPALPALEQDVARLWMVELARYQISIVPAITSFTDYRDYVDAETRQRFIPVQIGYNDTGAGEIVIAGTGTIIDPHTIHPTANESRAYGRSIISEDLVSGEDVYVKSVVSISPGSTGQIRAATNIFAGACGEAMDTHADATASETVSVASGAGGYEYNCIAEATISGLTPGDIVAPYFYRIGTHGDDTWGGNIYCLGFIMKYLAYRR